MSGTFLNTESVNRIKANIASGKPHFVAAYDQLIADAEAAVSGERLTITSNGGSPHFCKDAVYIPGKDGVQNPQSNVQGVELVEDLSTRCFTLALAWKITGDSKYADRLLEYIHCWCINQDTKMIPDGYLFDHFTPGMGYGGDISLYHRFPPFFLSMHVVSGYRGWDIAAHAAIKRWVKAMIEPQVNEIFYQGISMYNNWEDNRLNYVACGALFLDDLDILSRVFKRWRRAIDLRMTGEGELHRETMRTRSMIYTLLSLNRSSSVAVLADSFSEDLANYNINGKSLKLAIDYATKYLLDYEKWPFEEIGNLVPGKSPLGLACIEYAYSKWGDQKYLDALELWNARPVKYFHWTLLLAND